MAKLKFDQDGERFYETGVKDCVLFPIDPETGTYGKGVAWNGITGITNSPSGAEPTALWADDRKYLTLMSAEEFGLTIEAYTYPDEFAECDGSASLATGVSIGQQPRKKFALCYKTGVGNDEEAAGGSHYKLHIVYGCLASPSERAYATMNDSPEAITMSWEVSTTPVDVENHKPVSHIEIDSVKASAKIAEYIATLYGTDTAGSVEGTDPTLMMPADFV